jgi:hypothetical protein
MRTMMSLLVIIAAAGSWACGGKDSAEDGAEEDTVLDDGIPGDADVDPDVDGRTDPDAETDPDAADGPDTWPDTYIEPDVIVEGEVTFTIRSDEPVGPISPYIYGANFPDLSGTGRYLTLVRMGGNRLTAYNWETNASNAGSDWSYQSDDYLGGGDTPGGAVRLPAQEAFDAGASIILTVPIVDYVAGDKDGPVDTGDPDRFAERFKQNRAVKGSAFTLTPDPDDDFVYQDEFINWVQSTFPSAMTDPARTIFYDMDNEPDLWSYTHPEVHPDAVTYTELVDRTVEYAAAVKSVQPTARVFGFVSYGWNGFVSLQDAPDAGTYGDFIDYFLDEMRLAETEHGSRLVDVLDLHWYSEAQGGGVRIVEDNDSADVVAARLQAPRSLWDDGYTEESWITEWSTMGPIRLIPRLRDKIEAHYPGTLICFSEYNHGGEDHISGAIAEADVLGIFGREGVFAATAWPLRGDTDYLYGAFAAYRNYDGSGGAFGDTAVTAENSDTGNTSVYASVNAGDMDRMVVVAINKTGSPVTAAVTVTHPTALTHAQVYRITDGSPAPAAAPDLTFPGANAFTYEMPAMSVSTLVLLP